MGLYVSTVLLRKMERKCLLFLAMILSGDYYLIGDEPFNFIPYHVVTNEEDFRVARQTNYWVTSDGKTGEEASLYMRFQCPVTITGVMLQNTHNAGYNDRGTQNFTISIPDQVTGAWTDIMTSSLPDARNVSSVPVFTFQLETQVETSQVRFQVDSFYGRGGGLQYFSTF